MDPFTNQLAHLAELAKQPAWKAHACWRALELESDSSGLWAGIVVELQKQVPGLEKTMASVAQELTKRR